jgi:hypothetical protein
VADRKKTVLLVAIGAALIVALTIALKKRETGTQGTWEVEVEGFLAVATPCCYRASLWTSLDDVTPEGQRARAATTAEAAEWLNTWPYRSREEEASFVEPELTTAGQSTEVRCTGTPTGDSVPRPGDDLQILESLREQRKCTLVKWTVWSGETARQRPNERHTVWVDELDQFHGRVDYWR